MPKDKRVVSSALRLAGFVAVGAIGLGGPTESGADPAATASDEHPIPPALVVGV